MKWTNILYVMLVLATFGVGTGVGSLVGMSDAFDAQTQSISHRGLTFSAPTVEAETQEEVLQPKAGTFSLQGPQEIPSPGDWVKERQIEMRPDGVFIRFDNPQWAIFADTNSMDRTFDAGHHALQMYVTTWSQLQVGEILSWEHPLGFLVIHRIIQQGEDEYGKYVITQGDNNPTADPLKIRMDCSVVPDRDDCGEARRITWGLIY